MNIQILLSALLLAAFAVSPASALAFDDSQASDTGFQPFLFAGDFEGIEDPNEVGLIDTVINIINALLVLAAIAAIAFMIVAGVRFITAQGDEDATAAARNSVVFVIIGIIVILLAAVIVNFFVAQIATAP